MARSGRPPANATEETPSETKTALANTARRSFAFTVDHLTVWEKDAATLAAQPEACEQTAHGDSPVDCPGAAVMTRYPRHEGQTQEGPALGRAFP